jgi:hypothetical protein
MGCRYEETGVVLADIARVRVRTCAGGQGDAKEFLAVSSRDHVDGTPETKRKLEGGGIPFTYRVFQCESELETKMALDALARAFGASDSSNRLSAALASPGHTASPIHRYVRLPSSHATFCLQPNVMSVTHWLTLVPVTLDSLHYSLSRLLRKYL